MWKLIILFRFCVGRMELQTGANHHSLSSAAMHFLEHQKKAQPARHIPLPERFFYEPFAQYCKNGFIFVLKKRA